MAPSTISSLRAGALVCILLTPCGQAADPVEYHRDVLPVLSKHCFPCHGPDAQARRPRRRPLRLDVAASAFESRDAGAAIVPGDAGRSLVVQRILSENPAERMPPPEAKDPLSAADISALRRWVEQGAAYTEHWAWAAPVRPAVPPPEGNDWVQTPVDAFVLAGLEEQGLTPAPRADARTLARRLHFDLLGLPPDPQDIAALAADSSPDAVAHLAARLLASPHHAERLATWWLDLVRYADSTGIHADNPWNTSPFRDWVIEAFRQNLPFDQFTREQIGGDLIAGATLEQKVAASYNRLNLVTREGGSQAKEFLARYTADRVRNASEVWLAATLGCAECHDHKFDPITTREFYEFGAFFADIQQVGVYSAENYYPPEMPVPTAEQAREQEELNLAIADLEAQLAADTPELRSDRQHFEAEVRKSQAAWTAWPPARATSDGGARLERLPDRSVRASGPNPERDRYELVFSPPPFPVTALRLELLPDPGLPQGGPGRAANANLVISEIELLADQRPLKLVNPSATFSQNGYPVAGAVDGQGGRAGWAVMVPGGGTQPTLGVFELAEPLEPGTCLNLRLVIHQDYGSSHAIGRMRVALSSQYPPPAAGDLPATALWAILRPPAERSPAEAAEIARIHLERSPLLAAPRQRLVALQARQKELEDDIRDLVATVSVEPMVTRVLPRGNWMDDSGPVVEPGVPAVFGELAVVGRRPTRLDLADWLVRPDHPVVPRVVVNRLWKLFFGRGLVATLDDFGRQGASPTHVALLDWLACEFVDSGFDLRHVIRLLVESATYAQVATASPELRARDPYNELLARQGRFRLDAEFVRDNALVISGLLVRRVGGPSVRPYQPEGYYAHLNFPKRKYEPSEGEDLYRRGLYTHWQRQYVHPSLLAFDAPSRERCTAERTRSNTPLQALVLLNDPIYVEAARAFAERILREGGRSPSERITFALARALQRPPRDSERAALSDLVEAHGNHYRHHPEQAAQLLEVGDSPPDPGLDPAELAAWTSVARTLLNLHETITRS